jgi:hypothetical protein
MICLSIVPTWLTASDLQLPVLVGLEVPPHTTVVDPDLRAIMKIKMEQRNVASPYMVSFMVYAPPKLRSKAISDAGRKLVVSQRPASQISTDYLFKYSDRTWCMSDIARDLFKEVRSYSTKILYIR